MASAVVRTLRSSPEVLAVVGVGEYVEGRGRGMTMRSESADTFSNATFDVPSSGWALASKTYALLLVFADNESPTIRRRPSTSPFAQHGQQTQFSLLFPQSQPSRTHQR